MKSFLDIVEEIKSIVSTEFGGKKIFDKDIADVLGVTQMNFATMKKRNKIPYSELLDFCAAKSISINWLLYGQSPESLVDATNKFFMIKYLDDAHASAGGGGDAYEEVQKIEIPHEFAMMLGGERELRHIEAVNVTGDSMEPTFTDSDILFINRSKRDIQRGGVFTIRTESGLFIKRVVPRVDGMLDIISDNDVYTTLTLNPNEIEVVGKVVSKFGAVD